MHLFFKLFLPVTAFIIFQSCYTQLASTHPQSAYRPIPPQADTLAPTDSGQNFTQKDTVLVREYHWVDNTPRHRWYDWDYPYYHGSLRFSFYQDYYGCYWDSWRYSHHRPHHYHRDPYYSSSGGSTVNQKPKSLFPENQNNVTRPSRGERRGSGWDKAIQSTVISTKKAKSFNSGSSSNSSSDSKSGSKSSSYQSDEDNEQKDQPSRPRKRGRR